MSRASMASVHSSYSLGGEKRGGVMRCLGPMLAPRVCRQSSRKDHEKVGERTARRRRASHVSGIIEVELGGVPVRVGGGADAKTFAAVIPALKVIGLSDGVRVMVATRPVNFWPNVQERVILLSGPALGLVGRVGLETSSRGERRRRRCSRDGCGRVNQRDASAREVVWRMI
jgi:hypothetical protein